MRDQMILILISSGRLCVDAKSGMVYAPKSNTPLRAVGAATKKGYRRLYVSICNQQLHFMIHRIVWVSVNGPVPEGFEVDHLNRDKADNRIENLEVVTGKENMRRATIAGAFAGVGRCDGIRDSKGRFGKKAAGRMLDGRTWEEFPEVT